jgi:cysteine desulfurase
VAGLIGAESDEMVFTSCGSESNNLALKRLGLCPAGARNHIIISAVEHPAVTNTARFLAQQGFTVTTLPVDADGLVDPDRVRETVTDRTLVVSILHGQNEIGTLQPLSDIAAAAHERGAFVHTDAAQTVGKVPVNVLELGVDLLTVAGTNSTHRKGAGALYVRRGIELESLIHGGGHERGLRAGTENAAFAVALGRAAALAAERLPLYQSQVRPLRDRLHEAILSGIPDALLNGHPVERLPNTLNVSFPGVDSTELQTLVRDRLACSTGWGVMPGRPLHQPRCSRFGRGRASGHCRAPAHARHRNHTRQRLMKRGRFLQMP